MSLHYVLVSILYEESAAAADDVDLGFELPPRIVHFQ